MSVLGQSFKLLSSILTCPSNDTLVCYCNNRFLTVYCNLIGLPPIVIDCGDLKDPENGQVLLTGTICESTATYSCREGYALVGEQTRTCQRDASWSGQAPFCRCKSSSRVSALANMPGVSTASVMLLSNLYVNVNMVINC